MAKRLVVFVYGSVSYLVFFLTFVYAVGFIGNLYVPKSMDSAVRMSFLPALVIDALLLLMFAVQHSVMARPGIQREVDAIHSGGGRAQHVRVVLQPVARSRCSPSGSQSAGSSGTSPIPWFRTPSTRCSDWDSH